MGDAGLLTKLGGCTSTTINLSHYTPALQGGVESIKVMDAVNDIMG